MKVSSYLYTEGLPDQTCSFALAAKMRVSNFLLWQIAYAEMYVSETLWPDFNRARLLEALVEFQKTRAPLRRPASAKFLRQL